MTSLRIGLAQCRQTASLDANEKTIFRFLENAARARVQILCYPETQTVGYRVDIATPETMVEPGRLEELHGRLAQRCGQLGVACILGTETPIPHPNPSPIGRGENIPHPSPRGRGENIPHLSPRGPGGKSGKPYNSALVISSEGKILGVHHKTKLTPLDAVAYSPGQTFETFDLWGVKVGVVICFEGFRFPETTRECVRQGAQLVFHPQNNTTRPNDWKIPVHQAMIVTRAAENTIWFASCNICHDQHQNCRSMVVAPDGQIHCQTELKQEQLLVDDLDIDLATQAMFKFDTNGCAQVLFGDTVKPEEYAVDPQVTVT